MNNQQFNERKIEIAQQLVGMNYEELIAIADIVQDKANTLSGWERDVADSEIVGQFNMGDVSLVAMKWDDRTFFVIGSADGEELTLDSLGHEVPAKDAEYITRLMSEIL